MCIWRDCWSSLRSLLFWLRSCEMKVVLLHHVINNRSHDLVRLKVRDVLGHHIEGDWMYWRVRVIPAEDPLSDRAIRSDWYVVDAPAPNPGNPNPHAVLTPDWSFVLSLSLKSLLLWIKALYVLLKSDGFWSASCSRAAVFLLFFLFSTFITQHFSTCVHSEQTSDLHLIHSENVQNPLWPVTHLRLCPCSAENDPPLNQ